MSVIDQVKDALASSQPNEKAADQLKEHQAIFEQMKVEGAVKQQGYTVIRPMGISRKEAATACRSF